MIEKNILLNMPINQLPVSEKLVFFGNNNNFGTLKELLSYSFWDLVMEKGCNLSCMVEIYKLLQENDCLDYLTVQ